MHQEVAELGHNHRGPADPRQRYRRTNGGSEVVSRVETRQKTGKQSGILNICGELSSIWQQEGNTGVLK